MEYEELWTKFMFDSKPVRGQQCAKDTTFLFYLIIIIERTNVYYLLLFFYSIAWIETFVMTL